MKTLQNPGGFVISLDFELHWGVRDHRTVDQYRENLLGVQQAIPAMLHLFEQYKIRATWATVGFLFYENRDALKSAQPAELPHYCDINLDPYAAFSEIGKNEEEDPFHFAPSLLWKILAYEGQEIGTHTFSHFYVSAPGPTLESFRADLKSAKSIAAQYGISLKSIVFPRNQISRPHIGICAEEGLIAYRSTEAEPWVEAGNEMTSKAKRFADSYLELSGNGCATPKLDEQYPIVQISQSRFLRPWNKELKGFESLRLKRILSSMDAAAKSNQTFHLWWHPHNFGVHLEENMKFLTLIAEHYSRLNRETGWSSRTMSEVAENVLRAEKSHCTA
jgi:peptidoglycan/xylan/chitin deacetylase (PgdA/CDA1 family)